MGSLKMKSGGKSGFMLLSAVLILAVSLPVYINHLTEDFHSTVKSGITKNTEQNAAVITNAFDKRIAILTGLADFIGGNTDLKNQTAMAAIKSAKKNGLFSSIAIADADGSSISDTGLHRSLTGFSFFKTTLNGRNTISNGSDFSGDAKKQIVFSVPVYQNKTIVGVLYASTDFNKIESGGISVSNGGTLSIINKSGDILFRSGPLERQVRETNLFSTLTKENPNQTNEIDSLKKDINLSVSGLLECQIQRSKGCLYSVPLGASDWSLAAFAPMNDFLSQYLYILISTGLMALVTVCAFCLLCIYAVVRLRGKHQELLTANEELNALTANIPGCFMRCKYDGSLTILYCSEGFFYLTGYTREEISTLFDDKHLNMIYMLDREKVLFNIDFQLQNDEIINIQYRMPKKDGTFLWIFEKGRLLLDSAGVPEFCSTLTDITSIKENILELETINERYQIVLDQSDSIIFEYNILNDFVSLGKNMQNLSGGSLKDFLKEMNRVLLSDDMGYFRSLFDKVRGGEHNAECECRMKNGKNPVLWCNVKITTIFDENNRPVRAIGTISDITCQKEATQMLMEKAERDALTGLLNKSATKRRIEEALMESGACALYMIDVDYFKNVNDSLGHLFGDNVLAEIGSKIQKLFRATDIIGRIGGDEFMVLLKNATSLSMIAEKAKAINECLNQEFISENERCTISSSVGIALYPKDAQTYCELYQKADLALYQAKRTGRNRYVIYNEAEFCDSTEDCSCGPFTKTEPGVADTFLPDTDSLPSMQPD